MEALIVLAFCALLGLDATGMFLFLSLRFFSQAPCPTTTPFLLSKQPVRVEEDLMAVFPRESWAKLHLQFIYFGREHCQVREETPYALGTVVPRAVKNPLETTSLKTSLVLPSNHNGKRPRTFCFSSDHCFASCACVLSACSPLIPFLRYLFFCVSPLPTWFLAFRRCQLCFDVFFSGPCARSLGMSHLLLG